MAKEGTMVVLAYVAKQDGFFKASDVFNETGLDRPLIYYHLGRFVSKGYLEKQGQNYCVLNKNDLIEALVSGRKSRSYKATKTVIYNKHKDLNQVIDTIVRSRAMFLPGSKEAKDKLNEAIDQTVESFRSAKRGLNSKQMKKFKAQRGFDAEQYVVVLKHLGVEYDEKLLQAALEDNDGR